MSIICERPTVQRAGTFLSNAGVLQVFGVNDHNSARLVSDLLGQETVVFQTMARALDSEKSGISYSQQDTGRPLFTPDEVRNMPQQAELLFLAGQRPIVTGKLAYFADAEFRDTFDPDEDLMAKPRCAGRTHLDSAH
ncbi:MAG: type IV secretory system conjugative DNA transfer family protein [Pantoea sp.]|uniref:type IV secretory system conjugative DNA transfer family protein n=1 Tax=Pantoea sp. TaxID=69393 RepID=UPI00238C7378|nr:type IV secretory system conjugative DNA transfer family protein [Pantoea sp.]MDE1187871.1 type IV secretory system conjugative DNA transfer family protein [Pantoea sp.]